MHLNYVDVCFFDCSGQGVVSVSMSRVLRWFEVYWRLGFRLNKNCRRVVLGHFIPCPSFILTLSANYKRFCSDCLTEHGPKYRRKLSDCNCDLQMIADRVFGENATTLEMYNELISEIICSAMKGVHGQCSTFCCISVIIRLDDYMHCNKFRFNWMLHVIFFTRC